MTARDLLLSKRLPGNPLDQQAAAQRALTELANREIVVPQLSGIAQDFGLINAGTIVMGNGLPLGAGFTGVMQFADPLEWPAGSGSTWTYIGFNADVMTFGISAQDGRLYAASGKMTVDASAISMNDLLYALSQTALDSTGKAYYSRFGMANASIGAPHPAWEYVSQPGANLVANPDFETGSLLHWTTSGGTWSASTAVAHGGSYSARVTDAGGPRASSLQSDPIAVTGGADYEASVWYYHTGAALNYYGARLVIEWYDAASGGSLLSTTQVLVPSVKGAWIQGKGVFTAPANALGAIVYLSRITISGGDAYPSYFDDVAFGAVSPATRLSMEPEVTISGSGLKIEEQPAPATPAAGFLTEYADALHNSRQISSLGQNDVRHRGNYWGYTIWTADAGVKTLINPTIKAGALGTKGILLVDLWMRVSNTGATSVSTTLVVTLGGTTLFSAVLAATGTLTPRSNIERVTLVITNAGAANAQIAEAFRTTSGGVPSATSFNLALTPYHGVNVAAENTAADVTLSITQQLNTATNSKFELLSAQMFGPYYGA